VLVALNLRVALVCIGPVLPAISADLDLGAAAAGFVAALPLLTFAIVSPVTPGLARLLGADRCAAVALVVLGAGTVIRSLPLANAIWAGTVLLGAAIAVLNVLLPSIISRDLRAENSRMTAFYTAAQGIATAIGVGLVIPLSLILPGGWRTATAIWAVLAVVAVIVWWSTAAPERRGSAPTRLAGEADPRFREQPRASLERRALWRSPVAWVVSAFMGLQSLAFYVYMAWIPSHQLESGVPELRIGVFTAAFYIVSISASLGTGRLLERVRSQRIPAVASSLLIFATYLGILLAPQLFALWSVTGGAACGSLMVIALSLITYRTGDFEAAARLSAMSQGIGYAVAAAGPVLFGALLDAAGGWIPALALAAATMLVMTAAGWWAGASRTVG